MQEEQIDVFECQVFIPDSDKQDLSGQKMLRREERNHHWLWQSGIIDVIWHIRIVFALVACVFSKPCLSLKTRILASSRPFYGCGWIPLFFSQLCTLY
uniref:Uncharacterized protein n=1 Tax=Heterorhabditis bacteriophora TaxID=37862 RepID=A0A1I7XUI2_HETBA